MRVSSALDWPALARFRGQAGVLEEICSGRPRSGLDEPREAGFVVLFASVNERVFVPAAPGPAVLVFAAERARVGQPHIFRHQMRVIEQQGALRLRPGARASVSYRQGAASPCVLRPSPRRPALQTPKLPAPAASADPLPPSCVQPPPLPPVQSGHVSSIPPY